jgi:hypothetical protein
MLVAALIRFAMLRRKSSCSGTGLARSGGKRLARIHISATQVRPRTRVANRNASLLHRHELASILSLS